VVVADEEALLALILTFFLKKFRSKIFVSAHLLKVKFGH